MHQKAARPGIIQLIFQKCPHECWEKWEQKLKEQPSSAGFPPPPPDHQKGKAIKKDGIRLAGQSQNEE